MNVIKLIENTPNDKLIPELDAMLVKYQANAIEIFGEGSFGGVFRPNYSPVMSMTIKNKKIVLNTIVKQIKQPNGLYNIISQEKTAILKWLDSFYGKIGIQIQNIDIPDKIYILASEQNIICELIFLMYVSKLWYESESPHVPFLITPLAHNDIKINSFLLEMNGLPHKFGYNVRKIPEYNIGQIYKLSHVENMYELIGFISNFYTYDKKSDKYLIPKLDFNTVTDPDNNNNNAMVLNDTTPTVDVVELLDSLILSYIITLYQLKTKLKLTVADLHSRNIYISFLKYNNYVGSKTVTDLKTIVYNLKQNNKTYEIPVNDILLKIGDLGLSVICPKSDLYIISDTIAKDPITWNRAIFAHKLPYYERLLSDLCIVLPICILNKTIIKKIYDDVLSNYSSLEGYDFSYPTEAEIIDMFFSKFETKKNYKDSDDVFVVDV